MISPEQQQLDEALTVAGHSDACSAFEMGRACSGHPVCNGTPVPGVAPGWSDASHAGALLAIDAGVRKPDAFLPRVTLHGPAALAFEVYKAAARSLRKAEQDHREAQKVYQEAHQAFAEAAADA